MGIGENAINQDRIRINMMSVDSDYAPLYTTRKDHKKGFDPIVGPPSRPMCSADIGYNYKMSYLLSTILSPLFEDEEVICENTEGMIAEIEDLNKNGIQEGDIIGSMDVKALYPSLEIEHAIHITGQMMAEKNINITNTNDKELGLYLTLNTNAQKLRNLGIAEYCPDRKYKRGPKPTITASGSRVKEEDRYQPWVFQEDVPDDNTRRKMFIEAIKIAIRTVMKNHIYIFNNTLRRQKKGGPIGLTLTGILAQIVMVWWDHQLHQRLIAIGINKRLYKRYVDDVNIIVQGIPKNRTYNGTNLIEVEGEQDKDTELDKHTMEIIQKVANEIHPSIEMEIDFPSQHPDKKLPILDIKVWIKEDETGNRMIEYEYYMKPVASLFVIHQKSATPNDIKRTTLTQEALRIMLNCSKRLPKETRNEHLNKFMKRMQISGYDKGFRYEILCSAMKAYEQIRRNDEMDIRPMYRHKTWRRKERMEVKENKKRNWFRRDGHESVIFVPTTPKQVLKRDYEKDIRNSGIKIKVVETTGTTIKNVLQRSDPFREKRCNRPDCFLCNSNGRGSCRSASVNYVIECQVAERCGEYIGETAENAYIRGKKHKQDLEKQDQDSALWKHCVNKHNSEEVVFKMSVTRKHKNDAMLRQIIEGVSIKNDESTLNSRMEWNQQRVPRISIVDR